MLIILCGLQAAGETTLARAHRDRLSARGREFDVLHSDEFSGRTYERMAARLAEAGVAQNREREEPISERGLYATAADFEPPRADLILDTDELSADAALDRLEAAVVRRFEARPGESREGWRREACRGRADTVATELSVARQLEIPGIVRLGEVRPDVPRADRLPPGRGPHPLDAHHETVTASPDVAERGASRTPPADD